MSEARFELYSLLSSAKFVVSNFIGGDTNTWVNVGWKPLWNAVKLAWGGTAADRLYANYGLNEYKSLNPQTGKMETLSGKDAVSRLFVDSGLYYSFLKQELGIIRDFDTSAGKLFMGSVLEKAKLKEISVPEIIDMAKKHKLSAGAQRVAGAFIGTSEAALRKRAFLAHYMNAKDFGAPEKLAVYVGIKGVTTTQFLYDLANRSAFTRTSMGQVLSRFQHWSWNSVAMRKNIVKTANIYGLGSKSYDRLKRMATLDIFMFTLASAFMSSIFESALPAPYNWLQDTAEWIFGDKKERQRAFMGSPAGPLQIITPPIARIPMSTLGAVLTGSWDKFLNYQLWTFFPFGRLARETVRTARVPEMAIEFTTGIPVHDFGRQKRKLKEEEPFIKTRF